MTVSPTATFELNRAGIIRRAFQLAGAYEASQEIDANDDNMAADLLQMVLLDLQVEGDSPTEVERATLSLSDGTASYALPSDTFDVVFDANNFAGTVYPASGTETPIFMMTRAEYIGIPDKDTSATPTRVYVERLVAAVNVVFWPVPDEAMTFRYQRHRVVRDLDTGARTPDRSKRWQLALTYLLAGHLAFAKSMPLDRRRELAKEGEALAKRARASDVEKGHVQMCVGRY